MKRPETPPQDSLQQLPLEYGKGRIARAGKDITIIASGLEVAEALIAAETLSAEGIDAAVIDMHTIKPLDTNIVLQQAAATGAIVTAENHTIIGGLGAAVAETLADAGIGLPFKRVGIQDQFCEGGTTPYLMQKFGLDSTAIADACRETMQRKG